MRFLLLFVAGTVFAERVPWEASKIHGTPKPPPLFELKRAFPQLNFTNPVELTWATEFKRFMLVELGTKVHLFANDPKAPNTTVLPTSAMPPGLLATLTTQQAADLLAYLRSLK